MIKKILGVILLFCAFISSAYAADLRFAQIDGLMYTQNADSEQRFDKIINEINKQKNISFVLFSGNNIAKAKQENLDAFLKEAKKLNVPYYVLLGNKDVNKQKKLGKEDYLKSVSKKSHAHKKIVSPNYVFEKNGMVFIAVDGSKDVIPTSQGYYRPDTVSWLDNELTKYRDKNVVILQHFPIIPPAEKESHYTAKPDEFLKVLAKHSNVKAIISGHFDVNNEKHLRNIIFISTAEAPVYRIIDVIDADGKNPTFWSIIKE